MQVRELIELLRLIQAGSLSSAQERVLSEFLTILAPIEEMDLNGFFALLTPSKRRSTAPSRSTPGERDAGKDAAAIASSLRDVFSDDAAFPTLLRGLAENRSVTIQTLKEVFAELFNRDGGFRSKATKSSVVQKIIAERTITVRDGKMAQMLGRKPAHVD